MARRFSLGPRARRSNNFAFALLLLGLSSIAQAGEPELKQFRGSLVLAEQSGGSNSFSVGASWNPTYSLSAGFGLEGQLGLGLFSTALGGDFALVDYEVFGTYAATQKLSLELGGGAQYWSGAGGNVNSPALSVNGVYRLAGGGAVKAVFAGFTEVLVQSLSTSILRAGIAF